jgi:hypothetical protein
VLAWPSDHANASRDALVGLARSLAVQGNHAPVAATAGANQVAPRSK